MVNSVLTSNSSILFVGAEQVLDQEIDQQLQASGFGAVLISNPELCLEYVQRLRPALIVIDRALNGDTGLQLCQKLREAGAVMPVLLLMSQDRVEDRVACLEAGADDYLLKPYRTEIFLRWVNLHLNPDAKAEEQLRFESLSLDLNTRRAERHGRQIDLTMKEFELLKYLMDHPRQVLNREQILENVWGYDFVGESNVIEVYIRYLRLKVEEEGEKRLIHTVRGVGYVLRET
jgi:two-component system, OmpR family, response regulator NblR